jgi:hypothetical protein
MERFLFAIIARYKHPIPSKSGNTAWTPWFVVEAMLVIAFGMLLVWYARAATRVAASILGTSILMYVVPRVVAFAAILAFLHLGSHACLAGMDRSLGWIQ